MSTLGIPITFLLLSASILWMIIGGKGHWILKMAFVTIALYFAVALWVSLGGLIGWPSRSQLPEKFQVNWIMVKELPPGYTEENSIYLWVTELNENNQPKEDKTNKWVVSFSAKKDSIEPRSFRVPYSRQLHKEAAKAQAMLRAGKPVVGTREGIEKALLGEDGKCDKCNGTGKCNGGKCDKCGGTGKGDGKGGKGDEEGRKGNAGSMSKNNDSVFHILPPPLLSPKIN